MNHKTQDVQHINVNVILSIIGMENMQDFLLNVKDQTQSYDNKVEKLLDRITNDNSAIDVINSCTHWASSKHHRLADRKDPQYHWGKLHGEIHNEFNSTKRRILDEGVEPLWLFADILETEVEKEKKPKHFKAWN